MVGSIGVKSGEMALNPTGWGLAGADLGALSTGTPTIDMHKAENEADKACDLTNKSPSVLSLVFSPHTSSTP